MRILCALALLFVGFAHQPLAIAETVPLDLAAYALPDGTLPVFCLTDKDGGQTDKHVHASDCDACRISAATLLPQPADIAGRTIEFAAVASIRPVAEILPRRVFHPSAAPRAPPAPAILT